MIAELINPVLLIQFDKVHHDENVVAIGSGVFLCFTDRDRVLVGAKQQASGRRCDPNWIVGLVTGFLVVSLFAQPPANCFDPFGIDRKEVAVILAE
jgi:hypothetical protein